MIIIQVSLDGKRLNSLPPSSRQPLPSWPCLYPEPRSDGYYLAMQDINFPEVSNLLSLADMRSMHDTVYRVSLFAFNIPLYITVNTCMKKLLSFIF